MSKNEILIGASSINSLAKQTKLPACKNNEVAAVLAVINKSRPHNSQVLDRNDWLMLSAEVANDFPFFTLEELLDIVKRGIKYHFGTLPINFGTIYQFLEEEKVNYFAYWKSRGDKCIPAAEKYFSVEKLNGLCRRATEQNGSAIRHIRHAANNAISNVLKTEMKKFLDENNLQITGSMDWRIRAFIDESQEYNQDHYKELYKGKSLIDCIKEIIISEHQQVEL